MLVSRLTDLIDGCGISVIVTGSGDSITNGLPQARILDIGTVHHPTSPHPPVIVVGAGTYIVNGRNQARLTSICACGSPVITGSGDHICTDSSAPSHVFPPIPPEPPPKPEEYFIVIHDSFCQSPMMIFDEKFEIIKPGTDYTSLPYHYVCERIAKQNSNQETENSNITEIENPLNQEYDIVVRPARSIAKPCLSTHYPDMIPIFYLMGFHICVVGLFEIMELKDEHYEKICNDAVIPLMNKFNIKKNQIFLHTEVSTQPQYVKCPGMNFNKAKLLSYIKE